MIGLKKLNIGFCSKRITKENNNSMRELQVKGRTNEMQHVNFLQTRGTLDQLSLRTFGPSFVHENKYIAIQQ